MSDLKKILEANEGATLNSYSYDRFSSLIVSDATENDYAGVIKAAIQKIYADAIEDKEDGPYQAVCHAAIENPIGEIIGETKGQGSLIQVIARIPKLHQSIPKPIRTGPQGLPCKGLVKAAILMHPVFYATSGGDIGPLPKPGNIVEVDFDNLNNTKYGTYLGLVDDSVEAIQGGEGSAKESFSDEAAVTVVEDN